MRRHRVAVIGVDSITPVMAERFVAEGRMPNLRRLMERGWWAETTSTMPPTTPAAWATVATGAWPSTHGVEGFAVHLPGDPLDRKTHTCSSDWVRAETLWHAAERAGRRTILLKYPMSWPPNAGELVLQVDGAGGWGGLKCVWDLCHSASWSTGRVGPRFRLEAGAIDEEWITRDQDNLHEERVRPLTAEPPGRWTGLPPGVEPRWETHLDLRAGGADDALRLHVLVACHGGGGRVALAPRRDAANAQWIAAGDWSPWIRVALATGDGERAGHVRFKVMELDVAERRLRLYQTQVHQEAGFTRPAVLAAELLERCGPFVEWTESYDRLQGWIDDATQLEIYEQHVEWMSLAARHLLRHHPWDLFMTQVHFLDMAYHLYWGAVDPGHPDHDPARAAEYWKLLGRAHELADRFIGAVGAELDTDAVTVVLGDHGHDLYHTALLANHLLASAGLLALYQDRRTGGTRIDWRRTEAFAGGYRVYVNRAGRDPHGVVDEGRYETVREAIVQALYGVRDPRTGAAPVRLAVRREDAESLGVYGDSMGDVVFAMAPGYQTRSSIGVPPERWIGPRLAVEDMETLRPTRLFEEFTGEHDTSLPLTRAIRSLLVMDGAGVAVGRRRVPARLVDVAPTICRLMGIPHPARCEGGVIEDALRVGPD
jgi:predicted AlkP superfamily phosphohydrolase/phosphomutase